MASLPAFDTIIETLGDPAPSWTWVAEIGLGRGRRQSSADGTGFFNYDVDSGRLRVNDADIRDANRQANLARRDPQLGFRYRVEEIPAKYFEINDESRYYAGSTISFPGSRTFGQISITFYESSDYASFDMIRNWMDTIIDEKGNYGVLNDYVRNISLYAFDGVNANAATLKLKYIDCWPLSISEQSYSFNGTDRVKWTVPFAVHDIKRFF